MKKSLSRILSVALILAMMVSVIPFAMAAENLTVTVSSNSESIEANGFATLTATYSGVEGGTASYSWKVGGAVVGTNSNTYIYNANNTGTEAQTVTITCDVTVTKDGKEYPGTDSATITVQPAQTGGLTSLTISGESTVYVGKDIQLTATPDPAGADISAIVWDSTDKNVATVTDGVVHGVAEGTATITANVGTVESNKYTVTVKESEYELTAPESVKLVVDDKTALTITAKKNGETIDKPSYAFEVESGKDYISLNKETHEVTAVSEGTAVITIKLLDEAGENVLAQTSVTVEVVNIINCPNVSQPVDTQITLTPTLTGFTATKYTYTTKSGKVKLTATEGSSTGVKSSVETTDTITITATYSDGGTTKTTHKDVTVYFYDEHTAEFTIKSGIASFDFDDTDAFTSIRFDKFPLPNLKQSVADVLTVVGAWEIKVLVYTSGTEVVTLQGSGEATLVNASNIKFNLTGKSGTQNVSYELKSKDGLIVSKGTIAFTTGGAYGNITYETDYNTPITFNEKDFQDFWTNATTTTGTLSKVVFGVSATSPAVPSAGTLWTSSNKSAKVTSAMEFVPGYTGVKNTYDLDAVYYVPAATKTYYTVEIPFVAYGGTTASPNQTLSGIVVIELNNSSTDITSRGVVFGSTTNNLVSLMAADYKGATNSELVSVVFKLPEVEDGRLYYDYDGILNSDRVTSKDEFFVEAADKQLNLKKVAFIPAAGTTGKITINYTGYGKDGINPYEGKLTLNVVAKTKSDKFTDVTATSYSWAADSIDFLYYEEVVNGTSSTKFGPASSITRGDFMIMLYRAFLEEDYGKYNVTSNFADVPKGTTTYEQETYQAIGVAKYLGIAKGDGTNFNPKSSITREEAMTLIYRTLDEVDLDLEYFSTKTTASFSDYSKVSTYAQTSITYLIRHGIVIGSNGLINPKSNITRAEMAVILHRVLTY